MIYLIRGTSGSGKSKFAENLSFSMKACWFEADMYYGENYDWSPEKLAGAHANCLEATRTAMIHGKTIVVSNTFCKEKDLQQYIELAKQHNYLYTVLVVENRSNTVNVHNVPEAALKRQANQLKQSIKLLAE